MTAPTTPPGAAGERSPAPGERTKCAVPTCDSTTTRLWPSGYWCHAHAPSWPEQKPRRTREGTRT